MEITVKGTPKEIADFVLAVQNRPEATIKHECSKSHGMENPVKRLGCQK